MVRPLLIKDGVFGTMGVVFIFGCLFVWAHAFHDESAKLVQRVRTPVVRTALQASVAASFTQLPRAHQNPDDAVATTTNHREPTIEQNNIVDTKHNALADAATLEKPATKEAVTPHTVQTKPTVIPLAPIADNTAFAQELRQRIIDATNDFRTTQKVATLSYEQTLQKSAQAYSETLLSGNFLSHTDLKGCDMNCRIKRDGFKAQAWGENLAVLKFSDMPSALEIASFFMREWEKSEGHRENLLSTHFTHQGIGIAISDHAVYVTVQFADPL